MMLSALTSKPSSIATRLTCTQLVLLLGVLSVLLALVRFNDIPVGSFWDDAHYIILAESLADGTGYRLTNFPDAPVEEAFPPGYPLLLTPLVTLFPENFVPLKLLSLAFWIASLPLLYRLFARRLPPAQAVALAALAALNPFLIGMATTVMSEAAFLFFSLLTLNLLQLWEMGAAKRPLRRQLPLLAAGLVSGLFTVLLRTIGITLLGGIGIYLLWKYGRRYAKYLLALFIGGAALIIPLAWFNARNGGALFFSPLYFEHVKYVSQQFISLALDGQKAVQVAARVFAGALVPVLDLSQFETVFSRTVTQGVILLVVLATVAGFVIALRRFQASDLYVLFYAGILYFWIVYTDELRIRLLLPVLPFLYLYLLLAVHALAGRFHVLRERQMTVMATAVFLILCASFARNLHQWQHPLRHEIIDLSTGAEWLRANSPQDAIVMTANPAPDYLYLRRQTINYPDSDIELAGYLEQHNVDYVLVRQSLQSSFRQESIDLRAEELLAALQAEPGRYRLAAHQDGHQIFLVIDVAEQ